MSTLTQKQLAAALRDIGLQAGDSVVVHSSLRTLGKVEGGADAVLDALLEVLTPDGNLMLPTFNYSQPLPEPYFDARSTPGRTGILTEVGRKRANAIRSLHPTHSVTVIGRDAEALTENHLVGRAFGVGSPLDRLAQRGGKVLLLGVGQTSNSTIHVAEDHAHIPKAPFDGFIATAKVLLPDGNVIEHQLDTSSSCSMAFEAAAYPLRRRGAIRDGRVGDSLIQLMAGRDVIEIISALLQEEPDALLCSMPHCKSCSGTRDNLARRLA